MLFFGNRKVKFYINKLKKRLILWVCIIKTNSLILMINSTNLLSWENIWTWGRQSDTGLSSLIASKCHQNNLAWTTIISYTFYQWRNKFQSRKKRSFVCDTERSDRDIQSCHNEPKPTRGRRDIFLHCFSKYIRTNVRESCLLWYIRQLCVT